MNTFYLCDNLKVAELLNHFLKNQSVEYRRVNPTVVAVGSEYHSTFNYDPNDRDHVQIIDGMAKAFRFGLNAQAIIDEVNNKIKQY